MTHRIRTRLLHWFDGEKRSLPWRGTRDPYRIWLSEVMLQQTTVGAVAARYERFLARFPDLATLARARQESVLAAWSGLGYYQRARNLWRAARCIMEDGGRIPSDPADLEKLPGFGKYMSAAVACLAFGVRAPAVDANVRRVLSRVLAVRGNGRDAERAILEGARDVLPPRRPGDGLAALMDLGQLVCTPRSPRCGKCPISRFCRARALGSPENYPASKPAARFETVHVAAAFVLENGRTLLVRKSDGPLAGLWTFPSAEASTPAAARRALGRVLRRLGVRGNPGPPAARARHTILRRRLRIEVFLGSAEGRPRGDKLRWLPLAAMERSATPTLTRKIARAAVSLARAEA